MAEEILNEVQEIQRWGPTLKLHKMKGFQKKSNDLSSTVRKEGNQIYFKKNHDYNSHQNILLLYTKSIALAVDNSEEQAVAYSNRSALLMHLLKYEECLVDISRAFKITQSSDLKNKLLARKEKCLTSINNKVGNHENSSSSQEPFTTSHQDIKMKKELGMSCEVFSNTTIPNDIEEKINELEISQILTPNKTLPSFSDSLRLTHSNEYGRHVVAGRDIKPGEILVIEKGFVSPALDKIYLVCSYCLKFIFNGIPCPSCVFVVYCSEKCKARAWKEYHDIECSVITPTLSMDEDPPSNMGHEIFNTLRIFIKVVKSEGLQNIIDQAKSMDNEKNPINKLLTNKKFDNTTFRSIFGLLSQPLEDQDKIQHGNFGSIATLLLTTYTSILKDYADFKYLDTLVQIKKIIIKLKNIANCNAFPIGAVGCGNAEHFCTLNCRTELGFMIAPSSSFFNHSCVKNVDRIFCEGGRIMLFSINPIKKNEQLFINYGPGMDSMPKMLRQTTLKKIFNFSCTCKACKNNWVLDPAKTKPDPHILRKMIEKLKEFEKNTSKNGSKHSFSIASSIKAIELSYKYFDNLEAYIVSHDFKVKLIELINKLYGIKINVLNRC